MSIYFHFASINTKCNQLSTFFYHYLSIGWIFSIFTVFSVCDLFSSVRTTQTHMIYYFFASELLIIITHCMYRIIVYVRLPRRYPTSRHLIVCHHVVHKSPAFAKANDVLLFCCNRATLLSRYPCLAFKLYLKRVAHCGFWNRFWYFIYHSRSCLAGTPTLRTYTRRLVIVIVVVVKRKT